MRDDVSVIPHRQEELNKNSAFALLGLFLVRLLPNIFQFLTGPLASLCSSAPYGFPLFFFMLFIHPSSLIPPLLQSPVLLRSASQHCCGSCGM